MNLPGYDAWKTRSPYEPGEAFGRGEYDYEPDLDGDRFDPEGDSGLDPDEEIDTDSREDDESRDEHLLED